MPIYLEQVPTIAENEVEIHSINYTNHLATSEVLTGTVTLTEITTADLTFANNAVNTAAIEVLGKTVAIGKGIQFKTTGQLAATGRYEVEVSVDTDSTPARTIIRRLYFKVV